MKLAVAALAVAVFAAGMRWGTFAVGGSDSYCYVHQAEGWASGQLQPIEPLALETPWPDAPLTFAPTGHIPSPTVRGASVPICPAGLSVVMAPFLRAGRAEGAGEAGWVFLIVPLFGALLVSATYLLGSRFSTCVGVASAVLAAASPVFLFQLMQPMSDVPAAALWLLATAFATSKRPSAPLAAGLVTSAAIFIRPNLLPLGVVLGLWFMLDSDSGDGLFRTPTRMAVFAMACVPGCLAVALIQQMFYGSPLSSGYGSLAGLFSVNHIGPNATRYATWMWQTHTPAWLLALAAPFLLPRRVTFLLLALATVNILCYLPYVVFNDWWYLRFLLPAIAMLLVLTAAVVDAVIHRSHQRSWPVLTAFAVVLAFLFIRDARARQVFDLQRLESRYVRAGNYVATHLPPNALVITSWESGSVRFYGHRKTLVWDVLDPAWLDRAVAYSRTRGYEPYLLFETWEEPLFRRRFAGSQTAALDWPPMAEIASQVRIYRPDDRARYLRGDAAPTDYAR